MQPTDPDWAHDAIIETYIGCFAARTDLYVQNGAAVVREELNADVVRDAVAHHYAISAYCGAKDARTHVGAIDFDTTNGLTQGRAIQQFLDDAAVPSSLWESRRGAHLWVTCWDWVECGVMARMLRAAVSLTLGDEVAADPKVEVFPKPGSDLAVGALRLPGLPHHKDQQVYPLVRTNGVGGVAMDPTFQQVIDAVILTTPEAVRRLAGKAPRKAASYPKALGAYAAKRDHGDAPSATDVLRSWGIECQPGGTARCPKHDDKRRSLTVFKDDRRVYCGAPHCALNNGGHGVGSILLSRMAAP
jgi:hypothetical protein